MYDLRISAIRSAIIKANKDMFKDSNPYILRLNNEETIGLKRFKNYPEKHIYHSKEKFLFNWYGENLYDETIDKVIKNDGENESNIRKVLAESYNVFQFKTNTSKTVNRDDLFEYFSKFYSGEKEYDISRTIKELAKNIKGIIQTHDYATKILEHLTISDNEKDFPKIIFKDREEDLPKEIYNAIIEKNILFKLDLIPESRETVYEKLAAISLIALIPLDQDDQNKRIASYFASEFCNTFISVLASHNSETIAPDKTDIGLIRDAWKNWYLEKKNSSYSKLFFDDRVDEDILPTINDSPNHLYIKGEGGIGKTSYLYSLLDSAYIDNSTVTPIPMYVELPMAGKEDIRNDKCHYIRDSIYDKVKNKNITRDRFFELLSIDKEVPDFLLLLDDLSEVSRDIIDDFRTRDSSSETRTMVRMLKGEIKYIIHNYKNVKVIITGRYNENWGDSCSIQDLVGIDSEKITSYLNKKLKPERVIQTINNKRLMVVLRIPLFLIMYARLQGKDQLLSRGEILHLFFTQRKDGLYSQRSKNEEIEIGLENNRSIVYPDSNLTAEMRSFILDFIMPEISWHMINNNDTSLISLEEVSTIIQSVLDAERITDTSWCSNYGIECFSKLKEYDNTKETADLFFGALSNKKKWKGVSKRILEYLTEQLGVLVDKGNDTYAVFHKHIQDYFAALYHINKMEIATYLYSVKQEELARKCLYEWNTNPLPSRILTLIGEALGEVHNAPKYNEDDYSWEMPNSGSLVMKTCDIYRHRFNGEDKYAIWNLIQILKLVRKDLSGEDFSNLDLSNCRLNGYRLGNSSFAAKFDGSKMNDLLFMASGHSEHVNCSSFSEDGRYIVTASDDKTAIVWNTKTFEEVAKLKGHTGSINAAQFNRSGRYLLTASKDGTFKIWTRSKDNETTFIEVKNTIIHHTGPVKSAVFDSSGRYIVTASEDNTAKLWSFDEQSGLSKGIKNCIIHHSDTINSAAFNPDGDYIITASEDNTAKIWRFDKKTELCTEIKDINIYHSDSVNSAVFSLDGEYIVTASEDNTAKIWKFDKKTETCAAVEDGVFHHEGAVNSAEFSIDGKNILTSSDDKTVKIWNIERHEITHEIVDPHHQFRSASYSHDGKYIVTNTWRETKVWDTVTFSEMPGGTLNSHFSNIFSAKYNSKGDQIVIACRDGTAKIWSANDYTEIPDGLLKGHAHSVYSAVFSPDNQFIITASGDRTAKLWNSRTFREFEALEGHTNAVHTISFKDKTGNILATASKDSTIKIWKKDKNSAYKLYKTLKDHTGSVNMAGFDNTGHYLVSASEDGTILIWDATKRYELVSTLFCGGPIVETADLCHLESGEEIILSADHNGNILIWNWSERNNEDNSNSKLDNCPSKRSYASLSPNGEKIVAASWDGSVRIWEWNSITKSYEFAKLLDDHKGPVSTVVFSPDGNYILSASWDNTAIIWHCDQEKSEYKYVNSIINYPGLEVWGVDLSNLHDSNCLSKETLETLIRYGAKI